MSCFEPSVCDPFPGNKCEDYKNKDNNNDKNNDKNKNKDKNNDKDKDNNNDKNNDKNKDKNKNNDKKSNVGSIGWKSKGTVGSGWCVGERATDDWTLIGTCPNQKKSQVRVLTYNLFWWNLMG